LAEDKEKALAGGLLDSYCMGSQLFSGRHIHGYLHVVFDEVVGQVVKEALRFEPNVKF
jgi:hypothetical protein